MLPPNTRKIVVGRERHGYMSMAICGDGSKGQDMGLGPDLDLDHATDVDSGSSYARPHGRIEAAGRGR